MSHETASATPSFCRPNRSRLVGLALRPSTPAPREQRQPKREQRAEATESEAHGIPAGPVFRFRRAYAARHGSRPGERTAADSPASRSSQSRGIAALNGRAVAAQPLALVEADGLPVDLRGPGHPADVDAVRVDLTFPSRRSRHRQFLSVGPDHSHASSPATGTRTAVPGPPSRSRCTTSATVSHSPRWSRVVKTVMPLRITAARYGLTTGRRTQWVRLRPTCVRA
jgi:hypothetical protein